MEQEIERKFLVKKLPDLSRYEPIHFVRYFLYRGQGIEVRIQQVGDRFEFERKVEISALSRSGQKLDITQQEFDSLKVIAKEAIIRDSYLISESPEISLKIYHDRFEGLVRAEVEFKTEEEARTYTPPEWFGSEITGTALARDATLLELDPADFKRKLVKIGVDDPEI